jgi:septal ring factor EnvC (AmiA/AmiB activator)
MRLPGSALRERIATLEAELERARSEHRATMAELSEARAELEQEQAARRALERPAEETVAATLQLEELLRLREQMLGELRGTLDAYSDLLGRVETGSHDQVPAATANGHRFAGRLELDAGPFRDFAEVSAFERALGELPDVAGVSLRLFGDGRATLDVVLAGERPLLEDLTRLPYRVSAQAPATDRLVVDVLPPRVG